MVLALILILIFSSISILHFYWAFGGKKWGNFAVPSYNEVPLIQPRFFETIAVAISFIFFAMVIGMKTGFHPLIWVSQSGLTFILFGMTAIFLVRTVGEFRYMVF